MPGTRQSIGLAVASGLLLAMAFPSIDWSVIAWVALLPLLLAIEDQPPRQAFCRGWMTGVSFYLATLYWIVHTIGTYTAVPAAVAIIPLALLSAVLGLYTGAFAAGVAFVSGRGRDPVLFAPVWWVALEWLRSWLLVGFPWLSLGYSQYRNQRLVQVAEITGVYGLSALLVLFNVAVFAVLRQRGSPRRRAIQLSSLTLVLFAVQQFGAWRLADLTRRAPAHHLRAAIVQGNVPQDRKWDPDHQEATVAAYEQLTRAAAAAGVTLIVWPETAVPFFFQLDGPLAERVRQVARSTGAWLLFGSPAFEPGAEPELRLRNRVYLLSPSGETAGHYDKVVLVPFGEYVPLRPVLFFLDKIVEGAGRFVAGPGPRTLAFDGHRTGVLICYEAIFPALARGSVTGGADLLVNVTNDAWFGRTAAPHQHLAMAAVRAVEHRVPVLRAANSGVSAVVRPDGRIDHPTELFEPAYRVVDLSWPDVETIYRRYGDAWAIGCAILSAAIFLACLRRPGRRR